MKKYLLFALLIAGCVSPTKNDFRAIGHRGAAGHAPENTLAALAAAEKLKVHEVEIDVQLSKDNVLVLFHDNNLSQKTTSHGVIHDKTIRELKKTDIGSWYDKTYLNGAKRFAGTPLATLEEVFHNYGKKFYYHIEIKAHEPTIPQLLISNLTQNDQLKNVTITSFDFAQLERVRKINVNIPICYLVRGENRKEIMEEIFRAHKNNFTEVAIDAEKIETEYVQFARDLKLDIRGYGVKTKEHYEKLLTVGVYGSTLDHPDWVVR